MKIKDIMKMALAALIGAYLCALFTQPCDDYPEETCDSTIEQIKIKLTLKECSQTAMDCVWGEPPYREVVHEAR
jgi:hypothetical protein